MSRKDGAYTKTTRLQEIQRLVAKYGPVSKDELIAYIETTIGLRRITAENYLDNLVRAKLILYDGESDTYSKVRAVE